MIEDEGPSPEDIERFSGETAYCPQCGAEVWDQAERCPACGEAVGGDVSSRPPLERWWRQRWVLLVALLALVAFLIAVLA